MSGLPATSTASDSPGVTVVSGAGLDRVLRRTAPVAVAFTKRTVGTTTLASCPNPYLSDIRLGPSPRFSPGLRGITVPLQALKDDYYRAMGWNPETGALARSRADQLGMTALLDGWVEG